jgi:hypothetical protein
MSERIEEHPSLKNLRWRPIGLNPAEQEVHARQLQAQREEDQADEIATEALAKKTELTKPAKKPSR